MCSACSRWHAQFTVSRARTHRQTHNWMNWVKSTHCKKEFIILLLALVFAFLTHRWHSRHTTTTKVNQKRTHTHIYTQKEMNEAYKRIFEINSFCPKQIVYSMYSCSTKMKNVLHNVDERAVPATEFKLATAHFFSPLGVSFRLPWPMPIPSRALLCIGFAIFSVHNLSWL